jgi:hypothetical protein
MRVEPKTEAEVQEANLLPAGVYDFEVAEAEEGMSKAGNDMVTLKLRFERPEGGTVSILDWLVATDGMAYKTRHFAETTGMLNDYERGEMLAHQMIGKTGTAKLGITPAKGEYRAKNSVLDYLPQSGASASMNGSKPKTDDFDDSVPF